MEVGFAPETLVTNRHTRLRFISSVPVFTWSTKNGSNSSSVMEPNSGYLLKLLVF